MEHLHTTICALATPPGEGGIATVRVSGPDAYGIVGKIFAPVRQGKRRCFSAHRTPTPARMLLSCPSTAARPWRTVC